MSMLRFFQTVLSKVSFDERLFEKELRKATNMLMLEEVVALRDWCYNQFPQLQTVLNRCFSSNAMAAA